MKKLLFKLLFLVAVTLTASGTELPVTLGYCNAKACLQWETELGENNIKYQVYKDGKLLREVVPGFEFEMKFIDESFNGNGSYELSKVEKSSGRELARSKRLIGSLAPKVAFDKKNGFKFSNIFPVVGKPVDFSVTLANSGAVEANNLVFQVIDQHGAVILRRQLAPLPANAQTQVEFNHTFDRRGIYDLTFSVTASGMPAESFDAKFRVDSKPFYIHWYGNVPKLKYVNLRQGNRADIEDFCKNGSLAGCAGGVNGLPSEALLINLKSLVDQGFNALYLDEICGDIKPTDVVLETLPRLRAMYPKLFIAIWNIHDNLSPRVAELVKSGVIDLVMLEIYIKPGEDVTRIDQAARAMRKLGVADKVIIGLVTNKTWSGRAADEDYIRSLLNQIKRVHEVYPESPGIAFWDAITPDGMQEAAEKLILELYFDPKTFNNNK